MLENFHDSSRKFGLPPGTLVGTDDSAGKQTIIDVINYSPDTFTEKKTATPDECSQLNDMDGVTWINITGNGDIDMIQTIGAMFDIHPLIQEDIAHAGQRPKLETFDSYIFIASRLFTVNDESGDIDIEQITIVAYPTLIITFQEHPGDVFDPLRERIRSKTGRIRTMGADYLLYALIDITVDSYFTVLETLNDISERLEEDIITTSTPEAVLRIHRLKRTAIILRKGIWPMRDVIAGLKSDISPFIGKEIDVYSRDTLDHINRVIESLELLRDMISGLIDLNMANTGNRMNEIMKILSLIGTIFIPLTFIAGIYGMNFTNMPELGWEWGYFGALALMFVTGIGMVLFFKSRKWL